MFHKNALNSFYTWWFHSLTHHVSIACHVAAGFADTMEEPDAVPAPDGEVDEHSSPNYGNNGSG